MHSETVRLCIFDAIWGPNRLSNLAATVDHQDCIVGGMRKFVMRLQRLASSRSALMSLATAGATQRVRELGLKTIQC
eukprot:SAG11_NODE_56_length_19295_cov_20.219675_4_plen_77_part_00